MFRARLIIAIIMAWFVSGLHAQHNMLTKKERKQGWQILFDGKNTEHWRSVKKDGFPEKGWKVENGELVSGGGGNIITKKQYGDFELVFEWKMMDEGGNSGVKYLVKETAKGALGIEYQMLDDENHPWMKSGKMKPGDYHTTGAVYELYDVPIEKPLNPIGEWNHSRIVVKGSHVEHWLNGMKLVGFERDSDDYMARVAKSKFKEVEGFGLHKEGHIMLTDHGSVVHFRNIKIVGRQQ